MAEQSYIDIKGMQERIDEENQKKTEQFRADLNAITERKEQEQIEMNGLLTKALQSERDEAEKQRSIEMEAEKAKAAKEIETKYESRGIKSEETKQLDAAYQNLIGNIEELND